MPPAGDTKMNCIAGHGSTLIFIIFGFSVWRNPRIHDCIGYFRQSLCGSK